MEQKTSMSRRNFLRTTGIVASGALLAACTAGADPAGDASSGGAAAPASDGGTVRYWVGWGSFPGESWPALTETDEFQEMAGDYTVEMKGSSAGEVMLTALAAGDPPDGGIQYSISGLYGARRVYTH